MSSITSFRRGQLTLFYAAVELAGRLFVARASIEEGRKFKHVSQDSPQYWIVPTRPQIVGSIRILDPVSTTKVDGFTPAEYKSARKQLMAKYERTVAV